MRPTLLAFLEQTHNTSLLIQIALDESNIEKALELLREIAKKDSYDYIYQNASMCAPRVPRKELQILSGEQTQQFLEAARGDPLEALYVLALITGMRQGELLGLRWEDVDLDMGILQVKMTITRLAGKGFITSEPKTAKSRRRIHLPSHFRHVCVDSSFVYKKPTGCATRLLQESHLARISCISNVGSIAF